MGRFKRSCRVGNLVQGSGARDVKGTATFPIDRDPFVVHREQVKTREALSRRPPLGQDVTPPNFQGRWRPPLLLGSPMNRRSTAGSFPIQVCSPAFNRSCQRGGEDLQDVWQESGPAPNGFEHPPLFCWWKLQPSHPSREMSLPVLCA